MASTQPALAQPDIRRRPESAFVNQIRKPSTTDDHVTLNAAPGGCSLELAAAAFHARSPCATKDQQPAALNSLFKVKPAAETDAANSRKEERPATTRMITNDDLRQTPLSAPKPPKKKVSVAEAGSLLGEVIMGDVIERIETRYKNNPDVQLVRVADFFEKSFECAELDFNRMLEEYELSKLVHVPVAYICPKAMAKLGRWIKDKPFHVASRFVLELVQMVLEMTANRQSEAPAAKVGILIFLAIAIRAHPECLLPHAHIIRTNPRFHAPERINTILWIFCQSSISSSAAGVGLWSRALLPLMSSETTSQKTVSASLRFLEYALAPRGEEARIALEKRAACIGGSEALVPVAALQTVLMLAYQSETGGAIRLRKLYPRLRQLALAAGGRSGATAQTFLKSTLELAETTEVASEMHSQLGQNVLWCLGSDPENIIPMWRNLYLERLNCMAPFMRWLHKHWDHPDLEGLRFSEHVEALQGMVSFCSKVNKEKLARPCSREDASMLRAANSACRSISSRLRPVTYKTLVLRLAVLVVFVGVVLAAVGLQKDLNKLSHATLQMISTFLGEIQQACFGALQGSIEGGSKPSEL